MSEASVPPSHAPQPEPTRPSGGFPWVVCIVAAAVPLIVVMAAAAVLACAIFLKPIKPQPPLPAGPLQGTGASPASPAPKTEALPRAAALTADEAMKKVKALPEVVEWVGNVTAAGGSPHVDVDSENATAYTVHVYEIVAEREDMPSHTATMGWYTVDKATGEVAQDVP